MSTLIDIPANTIAFLKQYQSLGFKSEGEMIAFALDRVQNTVLFKKKLEDSAQSYAFLYETDEDLQLLTDSALNDID